MEGKNRSERDMRGEREKERGKEEKNKLEMEMGEEREI
jgi:hypothetical protein